MGLFLFASVFTLTAFSQPCDCKVAFDYTKRKIETNYSGFKDKVTADNRAVYNEFTDSLKAEAAKPVYQEQFNCVKVIASWLKFFKDGHVGVNISVPNAVNNLVNKDSIRSVYANSPKVSYTVAAFNEYLEKNKKSLKPLEGVWQNESGSYTIGIRYDNNKYTGFVLKADSIYWMPGQVKLEIIPFADSMQTRFYMRDHSLQIRAAKLDEINSGHFEVETLGRWFKLDEAGKMIFKDYYPNFGMVSFKRLSPKTNLLTIRSFDESFRKTIDSIVTANDKLIQSTDNLIIDVRGNGGGSDISYYPLRKYLFTHPYLRYGIEIYNTNDNIQKFRELATNPNYTAAEQERFRQRVKGMEEHLNQYWSSFPATFTSDTLPLMPKPKKIAVIIDSLVGSTTEQFLLDPVSNSRKATIYGIHSAGVLDYANVYFFLIPNTNIRVNYATSRSNRIDLGKGIDNTGIQPHVKLDNSIRDWVHYVLKDIEK